MSTARPAHYWPARADALARSAERARAALRSAEDDTPVEHPGSLPTGIDPLLVWRARTENQRLSHRTFIAFIIAMLAIWALLLKEVIA